MDKNINEIREVLVNESGQRIDIFLSKNTDLTRSRIVSLIKQGYIKQNENVITKPSYKVKQGYIRLEIPLPEHLELQPENIDLDIIYEDRHIVVLNKKAGIVVHTGAGNVNGTLVNALLFHLKELSSIGGKFRPGIVHRLDKNTSGLMVVAKDDISHLNLSKQFKDRKVIKKYCALVSGYLKQESGRIESNISRDKNNRKIMSVSKTGKLAITEYTVLRANNNRSLLDVYLYTGRTHQIRVHLSHLGHPIIGDELYGKKLGYSRHFLHCYNLSFYHPITDKWIDFKLDIPQLFLHELQGELNAYNISKKSN